MYMPETPRKICDTLKGQTTVYTYVQTLHTTQPFKQLVTFTHFAIRR